MAEKKKLHWSVKALIITVAVLVVLIVAFFLFFKFFLGIDFFAIKKQVRLLNSPINEQTYISNKFSTTDLASVGEKMSIIGLSGLFGEDKSDFANFLEYITGEENDSTYQVSSNLKLTDKELAALINELFKSELGLSEVSSEDFSINLLQIEFLETSSKDYEIYEQTSLKLNVIIKINLREVTKAFKRFPLNLVLGKFPDELFLKSTLTISTTNSDFGYTFSNDNLTVNSLSAEQTKNLFEVFKFVKLGTYTEIMEQVNSIICELLIGSDSESGFIKRLSYLGVETFEFIKEGNYKYLELIAR